MSVEHCSAAIDLFKKKQNQLLGQNSEFIWFSIWYETKQYDVLLPLTTWSFSDEAIKLVIHCTSNKRTYV